MIYFMQQPEGGPIKIGCTINLDYRRKQLETRYGCPLVVLATRDGGRDAEAEIHARFAPLRFGKTEQFRPGPDLLTFIGRPAEPHSEPIALMRRTALPSLNETKPRQFRLTEETLAMLDRVATHHGLKSRADAIRIATKIAIGQIQAANPDDEVR